MTTYLIFSHRSIDQVLARKPKRDVDEGGLRLESSEADVCVWVSIEVMVSEFDSV
jgi:hypothetical protein